MDDLTALALNGFSEANLEPDDGFAAVCQVVLNRARLHYQSDGTIQGTILFPNAFSWVAWDMVRGHYTKVAFTQEEEVARVADMLKRAELYSGPWHRALRIAGAVMVKTYIGSQFAKITPATVLYVNPEISHPAWALPQNEVCVIGHHAFYHA